MNRLAILFAGLACASLGFAFEPPAGKHPIPATGTIEVAFTPGDAADRLIIEAIGQARREVKVQAFTFTHRRIASALIRAHRSGVDVKVIADAQQANLVPNSAVPALAAGGVPVFLDGAHEAAHNKVIVIDPGAPEAVVITGSFNFTYSAQTRNAENVLVVRGNRELAARYLENWRRHREHSAPFSQ